jgi:hypothetical protein
VVEDAEKDSEGICLDLEEYSTLIEDAEEFGLTSKSSVVCRSEQMKRFNLIGKRSGGCRGGQ